MNVLFLSTENPYPPDHGHRIRTYNTLEYISRHHDVHYRGFIKNISETKNLEPLRKMCRSAEAFVVPDEGSKIRFAISLLGNMVSRYPYSCEKYYTRDMIRSIQKVLDDGRIDLVHFDILHMARYRGICDKTPAVLIQHNVEFLRVKRLSENSDSIVFKLFTHFQYKKLHGFEKEMCARFDSCAAVSDNDMQILKEMSPSANITVIPNGVDTEYFSPGAGEADCRSMVWVGGMKDLYNKEAVDYFCDEIFPTIYREIPDVKFTAVGKVPTRKLLDLASVNGNVKALGYVDDVRPYINSSSVFVAPIKSGGGTKLKILTALSMAKPVVTTSIGAEGIDVNEDEHIIIADDAKVFAQKTVMLLKQPEYAAKMGTKAREVMIEKYGWESVGRKLDRLYRDILKTSREQ